MDNIEWSHLAAVGRKLINFENDEYFDFINALNSAQNESELPQFAIETLNRIREAKDQELANLSQ